RSVTGIDLGASIQALAAEGLILRGGGHKMAAGLTLTRDQLAPAMDRLGALLARQGAGTMGPRELRLDGLLMPGAVTPELIERIEAAGPFGAGAAAPRFAFPDMAVSFARPVGETHLKLAITDGLGAKLDAIAFGAFDSELGPALANHQGARFHFAGHLELNHWNGRVTPQLRLTDAAPA
ncbi:MAG: single-stranded-DNA-specific exonuclease RecJ, partial [Maritimibacter sp.]|nr:single-stranded-DNA-specific exonuclease RecJ [Maritimibacter sp.]